MAKSDRVMIPFNVDRADSDMLTTIKADHGMPVSEFARRAVGAAIDTYRLTGELPRQQRVT